MPRRARCNPGELSQRTWNEDHSLLVIVADTLGRSRSAADIAPEDWAKLRAVFAKRWGPSRLGNAVVYTRSCWKWGFENRKLADTNIDDDRLRAVVDVVRSWLFADDPTEGDDTDGEPLTIAIHKARKASRARLDPFRTRSR